MRRMARFLLLLVSALALLAGLAYYVLMRTTRAWSDADLALRSRLAVASARESLSKHWTADRARLRETLTDITRDDRIMAAAGCSASGELLAATESYPAMFSCAWLTERMRVEGEGD